MIPAVLWNLAAFTMWGAFLLGLRYAIERRRQRHANALALGFLAEDLLREPAMVETTR
jgi:heme exporter protein C